MFQPPFQSGRTSPEVGQGRGDLASVQGGVPEGVAPDEHPGLASGDGEGSLEGEQDLDSLNGNSPADIAQAAAAATAAVASRTAGAAEADSVSTRTTDSGFSELTSGSRDPPEEKETTCEKSLKPEGTARNTAAAASFKDLFSHYVVTQLS